MNINPFAISEILTGFSCLGLGLFVYFRDPKRKLYQKWLLFNLAAAVWGFGGGVIALNFLDTLSLLWLWRITYAFGVLWIPVFFVDYVYEFFGFKPNKPLALIYAVNLIIFPLCLTNLVFVDVRRVFNSFYYALPNYTSYIFIAFWWHAIFAYGLFKLYRYMNYSDKFKKDQLRYFFWGGLIGTVGGSLNFLPFFKIDIYPWGNFAVPLYVAIASYAIVKHQLMDIKVVLQKTLLFSLFTFLVSAIYLLCVSLFYSLFFTTKLPASSLPLIVFSVIFIGLLFKPLEMMFQHFFERRFFKGTISEISEQKRKLESELERQGRLKSVGILAAGMAHEIKNPITAIQTFANYLPTKYGDPQFREKFQRIITQEVGRIKDIVSSLLVFSKPQEPNPRECDIGGLLKNILDLLSSDFLRYHIKINHNIDNSVLKAWVDTEQMKQMFLNIIMNAIDAMKEKGGELRVTSSLYPKRLEVSIKDTGCGISEDKLPHIFDPFYSDKDGGTGLGLAIAHSIIERNKGKIDVKSAVGQGSEFVIQLPASPR